MPSTATKRLPELMEMQSVARADPGAGDPHVLALADVDAVRVWAAPRRGDGEPPHVDAAALEDGDVHLRAVLAADLTHLQVAAPHQLQRLMQRHTHPGNASLNERVSFFT